MIPYTYLAFLAAIGVQRLGELAISRRNIRWARQRGGLEFGQAHFGVMKLLHTSFLLACATEVVLARRPFDPRVGVPMLVLVVASQALRAWTVRSLGPRWSARVVVLPGEPVVTSGPYRFLRHPNYLAVIVEGLAIPLVHGAWITALVFSVLNAFVLVQRIRCEENALARYATGVAQLLRRPRFIPALSKRTRSEAA